MNKRRLSSVIAILLIFCLAITGCSRTPKTEELPKGAYENEILTTTPVDQNKIPITVRVEFGVGESGAMERAIEEKFPQVDIVLRHDGTSNTDYALRTNLEQGTACDLLLSSKFLSVTDIAADYLLDLSQEDFIGNYFMTAVDSCTDAEGKVYFLPGPASVYGIVYNKVMFEENGWELPHSYSEFVALIEQIEQADLTAYMPDENDVMQEVQVVAFQPQLMYTDAFQMIFNTYAYDVAYQGVENVQWLAEYSEGTSNMVGHMEKAAEKFIRLFEDGVLSVSDWNVSPGIRSRMLYTWHSAAMIIECQNAVNYLERYSNPDDVQEIGMMPFWISDEPDSDYLYSVPSYYMGISKKAAEESEEKKQLLLDIYAYLSTVEGQLAMLDDVFQISSVKGVPLEENAFSEAAIDTIKSGRIINSFHFIDGSVAVEYQLWGSAQNLVQGGMTVEEWLSAADNARNYCLSSNGTAEEEVYGQVEETMTRLESAYTVAQMYQQLTDAQIGICKGGAWDYGTYGHFYAGDITKDTLLCITPNKEPQAEKNNPMMEKIVVASMTGQQIVDVLNNVTETAHSGRYPYYVAAGLDVVFNPWADEGERVVSCKLADGTELDLSGSYEVAYFNGSLPDFVPEPERALEQTWDEAFLSWLDGLGGTLKTPDMTLELVYSVD